MVKINAVIMTEWMSSANTIKKCESSHFFTSREKCNSFNIRAFYMNLISIYRNFFKYMLGCNVSVFLCGFYKLIYIFYTIFTCILRTYFFKSFLFCIIYIFTVAWIVTYQGFIFCILCK